MEPTRELIATYYSAFNDGDLTAFSRLLADDVVHDINQGERQSGKEAFLRFMDRMNACYREKISGVEIMVNPDGSRAAAEYTVDVNIGAAGIFTPVDHGFPSDGVLVTGELNVPSWVYGTLDLGRVREIRETGQVFNYRDWPRQFVSRPVSVVEFP